MNKIITQHRRLLAINLSWLIYERCVILSNVAITPFSKAGTALYQPLLGRFRPEKTRVKFTLM